MTQQHRQQTAQQQQLNSTVNSVMQASILTRKDYKCQIAKFNKFASAVKVKPCNADAKTLATFTASRHNRGKIQQTLITQFVCLRHAIEIATEKFIVANADALLFASALTADELTTLLRADLSYDYIKQHCVIADDAITAF